MPISIDKRAHNAFMYINENMEKLSLTELNLAILIVEILKLLSAQKADIKEYDEIMKKIEPLIAKELEFRSRDTQGTV